jgi:RPA family protein
MTAREPAWRVFAAELTAANVEQRGTGDRAITYLLSPAGARMSRVLAAGSLGPAEAIGTDPNQPFYRAVLTDPTGNVVVTAGAYQPSALSVLRGRTDSGPVVIVGKAHLFRGRDGVAHASIRAERVGRISEDELVELQREIATQTAERAALVEQARAPDGSRSELRPLAPKMWLAAAQQAARAYADFDLGTLRAILLGVPTEGSRPAQGPPVSSAGSAPTPLVPRPTATSAATVLSAAARAQESAFLDIVDELADSSADGWADLRKALQRAAAEGVREVAAGELLNRLEAAGVLEEPVVGKIRRTGAGPAN